MPDFLRAFSSYAGVASHMAVTLVGDDENSRTASNKRSYPFLTVTGTRYRGKVPEEEREIRAVLWDLTTPGSRSQQFWNLLNLHLDHHA